MLDDFIDKVLYHVPYVLWTVRYLTVDASGTNRVKISEATLVCTCPFKRSIRISLRYYVKYSMLSVSHLASILPP